MLLCSALIILRTTTILPLHNLGLVRTVCVCVSVCGAQWQFIDCLLQRSASRQSVSVYLSVGLRGLLPAPDNEPVFTANFIVCRRDADDDRGAQALSA